MIAAVYARKSAEQNTSDEEKSVTRQIDHTRALAARKGWTVAEEHVYADDGISGAEFLKRPDLTALLSAVRARPCPLQALITMEVSRLGREQTQTAVIVREIMRAGVRLFTYGDGREITQDSALDKFSLNALNFIAEMERELSRTRTREAMRSKAARGHVAGGVVFGYRNVRGADHVDREILDDQAEVIRRIFHEIAVGRGYAKVAQGLNADAIPCPRGRCWAMTCVREMVFRDLYRGRVVYGRTRWQDRGGTKVKVRVPESEWLTVDAPHLRIVPAELWQAAHERLDRTRQTYLRSTGGKLWGRPEARIEARHLLTGFVTCGCCGGAMHAIKRTSRRGRPAVYFTCNNWRVNGACANAMSVQVPPLDAVVLAALKADVLTPETVEAVVTRTIELARLEPDEHAERRLRLTSEAQRLADEVERLTEAIATGAASAALGSAVATREQQRADVLARLEHLDGLSRAPEWGDGIRGKLRARLAEWHGFLARQPEIARQILRKLLVGGLVLTPDPLARTYTVQGRATYGRLLEGIVSVVGVVPPG